MFWVRFNFRFRIRNSRFRKLRAQSAGGNCEAILFVVCGFEFLENSGSRFGRVENGIMEDWNLPAGWQVMEDWKSVEHF
jgi:hypothetical protein